MTYLACFTTLAPILTSFSRKVVNLGNALHGDAAIACYRKAIALDPKFAEAHRRLGLAYRDSGKLDEAVACYRRAIELDPKSSAAFQSLGEALRMLGRVTEADEAYRRVKELERPDGRK